MKFKDVGGPEGTCRGCKYFYHGPGHECGNGFRAMMNQTPQELCMKDPFAETQKKIDDQSNDWRTLREILEEGHELPARVQTPDGAAEVWLIGKNKDCDPICHWVSGIEQDEPAYDEPAHGSMWRIYEPPKEKKKWAPAWVEYKDGGVNQSIKVFSSIEEAERYYKPNAALMKRFIWPAPGFTPTELPE